MSGLLDPWNAPPFDVIFAHWAAGAHQTEIRLRADNRRREASLAGARRDVYTQATLLAFGVSAAEAFSECLHRAGPPLAFEAESDTFAHAYRAAWLACARRINPDHPEVTPDAPTADSARG